MLCIVVAGNWLNWRETFAIDYTSLVDVVFIGASLLVKKT
jgi:hypothetical protein